MASLALHHPHGKDFDRFLYATIGEDKNGNVVTVLSAFARLGFDPWQEASELGALPSDAARVRLGSTLSKLKDVPALVLDQSAIVRQLTGYLPKRATPFAAKNIEPGDPGQLSVSVGTVFAILMTTLFLLRLFTTGSGE